MLGQSSLEDASSNVTQQWVEVLFLCLVWYWWYPLYTSWYRQYIAKARHAFPSELGHGNPDIYNILWLAQQSKTCSKELQDIHCQALSWPIYSPQEDWEFICDGICTQTEHKFQVRPQGCLILIVLDRHLKMDGKIGMHRYNDKDINATSIILGWPMI